ncbi:hypothetical protein P4C99_11740 [Pontiellaceae bacterium B1224]|nr:hypothetical protein [Pontiellaceae bacterium B1224]
MTIKQRRWIYALCIAAWTVVPGYAATIYQTAVHNVGESWDTASKWSDGLGPVAGNAYINELGVNSRTPSSGGTFAGDSLTLRNASALVLKHGSTALSVDLIMENGSSVQNGGGGLAMLDGTMTGSGAIRIYNDGFASRSIQLDAQILPGNTISTIIIGKSGAAEDGTVFVNNAGNTFSGLWNVENGRLEGIGFGEASFNVDAAGFLDFNTDYSNPAGSLTCNGVLRLDQNLTFGTASIGGMGLEAGSYSASDLINTVGVDAAVLEDGLASTGTLTVLNTTETANSELSFHSNGEPATLVLNGVDRLSANSSDGFHLRYFDGENYSTTKMENIVTVGDTLTVSESGGFPRFTIRIDAYEKHVSVHLINVEGIPDDELRAYGLYLKLYSNASIGFKDLDDVIYSTGADPVYFRWQHLWGQTLDGRRGGVALYDGTLDGTALDNCLASIWAHEDLPHPAGFTSWTETDVLNWVENYRTNIVDLNEVILEADTEAELYSLTDTIVFPNNAKRVYLHCQTWRGEYWPKYNGQTHVNTDVFPNGEADLKAYADYLAAKGVKLRLHMVSFGIGKHDPDYVAGAVDRRLASWGRGTLEKAVDSSEKRLLFRPEPGTVPPLLGQGIAHAHGISYYDYFRIGEEIVQAGRISRTEEDVWVLENCTRGYEGTDAFAHGADVEAAGLYCSYGQNYIPEYDLGQTNSLMEEMVLEYTRMANSLELGHMHFDGPEIHRIAPWVERDLLDFYYSQMTVPASSSRVGKSIAANFEQDFSGIRDDLSLSYFAMNIDIRTDELHNDFLATSRLDTHFHVHESIMVNGRRAFFSVPMSGRGISASVMNNHGLFDEMNHLFGDWIKLAPVLHDDDVAYVDSFMWKNGNHYESEEVLVLSTNAAGKYVWTPHHVMGRTNGSDAPFLIEQEKGTHARKQTIAAGTTLTLNNPEPAQVLNFVIRVDHEGSASLINPTVSLGSGGSLTVTGTVASGQYLEYYGGSTAQLYDNNWNLLGNLPAANSSFSVSSGANTVTVNNGGSSTPTIETQFIVLGAAYVLKTNDNL